MLEYKPNSNEEVKEKKPKVVSGRNPSNRVYVAHFDADGYLCKKEISATHLTHVRSKARRFKSGDAARKAMKEFCEYNPHIKLDDGEPMMFAMANPKF